MEVDHYDDWLDVATGPVALTFRQELQPVLGEGSVFFPPTFAPAEGSKESPDYLIDDGIALIDTVGSQANRMEPLFKTEPYASLVPQARVKVGAREVNVLEAGHRAADALVRFSEKWEALRAGFEDFRDHGKATKLAKVAPTSIVFGAWDSRDTQAKLPRLVGSTIRAEGAKRYTRSAQYFSCCHRTRPGKQWLPYLRQPVLARWFAPDRVRLPSARRVPRHLRTDVQHRQRPRC